MKYCIRKQGTIDLFIVEANPVVFNGRLLRFEYIRHMRDGRHYRFNHTGDSYFRFVDVESGELSAPFGFGLHMGNAFSWEGRMVVTAVEHWGMPRFYQLESTDLVNWTSPRVILEGEGWQGYNTSICREGDGFLLTYELGAPKDLVGVPFTMFFARSKDMGEWKPVPGAVFGKEFYTGGPAIRRFGDWTYFFYLHGTYSEGFRQSAARSKDLVNWTLTPKFPILEADGDDRIIKGDFTEDERTYILGAKNINNSDMDFCEWNDGLYLTYSWGNQAGDEFLAEARIDNCTEREFCESLF
ncbi:MAG: hypothetical protein GX561_04340 [Lentisphaerae bacterium]|jgi:alpha-L-fucosidase|nr:hypothetical protein [Lentisphaerota bacterium]